MAIQMTKSGKESLIRDLRSDIEDLITQEFRLQCRLSELVAQRETLELTLKANLAFNDAPPDPVGGQSASASI